MSDSLEFRLLRYIVAVAEAANFTRAAERLFLSQPSLSKQIRSLEDDLRFPIFDRSRDGVRVTPAGEMILAYARETLRSREQLVAMARAVHVGEVPPLRLGFSPFVHSGLLHSFRDTYGGIFPGCDLQLAGGSAIQILDRIDQRTLDCAILPMPIDDRQYHVQQVAQSPLVVCMRSSDPLARQSQVAVQDISENLTVFRDPSLQPLAHLRLNEMFTEAGMKMNLVCSGSTPADIQWMVRDGFGLALIDQSQPLESGLATRPIAGVNWTADTAFVYRQAADHLALSFIERELSQAWRGSKKKPVVGGVVPEQLKLLAS